MFEIDGEVYLSSKKAAGVLGLSELTLKQWRYTGKRDDLLPYHKRFDGRIFYKESDLMALKSTFH